MPKPFGYVSACYLHYTAGRMKLIKEHSYDLMQLTNAKKVLDAGCGPGIDTVAIAQGSDADLQVVGVDIDEEMLQKADQLALDREVSHRVTHTLADVQDLPFEDEYFDAVRAERLFQNIPASHDAGAVMRELLRVLKSRGRIVLVDSDFASASVDFEDAEMERLMMRFCAMQMRPNGLIARCFYRMLKEMGTKDVQVHAFPLEFTNLGDSPFGQVLVESAVQSTYIDQKAAKKWMALLEERDRAEMFFACLNILVASGIKE